MPGWISYSLFVEAALKSTVVLGAAWATALLLRRRSAAVRHLVWSMAFLALITLPFLSLALPALRVPVADSLLAPGFVFQTDASASAQQLASHAGRLTANAPLS